MTSYDVYVMYIALRQHFSSETYDYFKFNKKVKTSIAAFEKRNDKHFFKKLSKHKDIEGFLLANLILNNNYWVGDLEQGEEIYKKHLKIKESLTNTFENDIREMKVHFQDNFVPFLGNHPPLLHLVLGNKISLETFIILNELVEFYDYWDSKIEEKFIWPSLKFKAQKFRPFVKFDKDKFKLITKNHFNNNTQENKVENTVIEPKNNVYETHLGDI